MKKSELPKILLLMMETDPPVVPGMAKWLGFGMSMPSMRQRMPWGELPRTTMSLRESSAPCTPAKLDAIRAGSPRLPANRSVSSTVNNRAEMSAASLLGLSPLAFPLMVTSPTRSMICSSS